MSRIISGLPHLWRILWFIKKSTWFNYMVQRKVNVVWIACRDFMFSRPMSMLPLFWRAKITLNTFSRPVLDEVHFLRLCCNPASHSDKHATESRACKTLLRKQVFPSSKIPFGSIWLWVVFRINEESYFNQRQKIRLRTERSEIG